MKTKIESKTENLSGIVSALEQAHALIQEKTGAPRATILVTRKQGAQWDTLRTQNYGKQETRRFTR
jgi:hypothetical protein